VSWIYVCRAYTFSSLLARLRNPGVAWTVQPAKVQIGAHSTVQPAKYSMSYQPRVKMMNLAKLIKEGQIRGLTNICFEKDKVSSACRGRKKIIRSNSSTKEHHLYQVHVRAHFHMDLFCIGLVSCLSIGGNKFGLIVDDYSLFSCMYMTRVNYKAR
jgi:hypothetical protein